ncbi:MAG: hypothetical protein LBQ66_13740 [Planctomycetaceae bacterium]|nr:hypothetical protein [Planctomycetaceae bacterium]
MGNRPLDGNVRWTTDRWAVVFSASEARRKQWSGKRVNIPNRPKRLTFWFCQCVFRPNCRRVRRRNRLAVGCLPWLPIFFGVPF